MKHEITSYTCDRCGHKLSDSHSIVNIVTSLSESLAWSRLHVKIEHRSGVHNNGVTRQAELCKSCTVELLTDALNRAKAGERVSAGVETSEQKSW